MKHIWLTAFVLLSLTGWSQSIQWQQLNEQQQEIMKVVVEVFDGMREADSAAVKKHFYSQVSSYTAFVSKEGKSELRSGDINNWFNAIAQPHQQVWDERIWDYSVQISGNLAAVWVKYAFYLDQDFHHCGVDAIQLAHNGTVWKIFHLADTRQQTGCEIPTYISDGATY